MDNRTKKLLLGLIIFILIIVIIIFIIHGKNKMQENFNSDNPEININSQIDFLNNILNEINSKNNSLKPQLILSNDQDLLKDILGTYRDTTIKLNSFKNNASNQLLENSTIYENINNDLNDLEKKINTYKNNKTNKQNFNIIKSHNNGQEFCLYYDDKSKITDLESNTEKVGYLININNGCLSVGSNDYGVSKCDTSNKKQYFKIVNILNDEMYKRNIDQIIPYKDQLSLQVDTPFVLLKSATNDNCLTNNHGYLTVQPCSNLTSQKWTPM